MTDEPRICTGVWCKHCMLDMALYGEVFIEVPGMEHLHPGGSYKEIDPATVLVARRAR